MTTTSPGTQESLDWRTALASSDHDWRGVLLFAADNEEEDEFDEDEDDEEDDAESDEEAEELTDPSKD